jgi:ABC-2 type transport system permease protein/oleandomycin transport system permease protein
MITVGYMIGFRFHNGFLGAVGMVGLATLFGFAFSWIFAYIGISVKDSETAQLASFVFIFPLTFASSAFVAIQTMPHWLQAFVRNQPITFLANGARQLSLGINENGAVWKILVWTLVILAIFIPLSLRQYKRQSE